MMNRFIKSPSLGFIAAGLILIGVSLAPKPVVASLSNCSDLYVGAIGLGYTSAPYVVFMQSRGDNGGSYAMSLADYSAEGQRQVLGMLLAAKMAGHRVTITSSASDQCSITSSWYNLRSVVVNNNP